MIEREQLNSFKTSPMDYVGIGAIFQMMDEQRGCNSIHVKERPAMSKIDYH